MLSVVVNMYMYSHEYEYNTLQWRLMWSNISVMTRLRQLQASSSQILRIGKWSIKDLYYGWHINRLIKIHLKIHANCTNL